MKCFLFALLFSLACFNYDVFAEQTALDRYIAKPDSNYSYFSYSTDRDLLYNTYFLYMTSQSWRSCDEVDCNRNLWTSNLWTHVIEITVPKIRHSSSPGTAILLVNGGTNGNFPTKTDDQVAIIAQALGSVVVKVNQIPNQPLYFADEENVARSEDAIIAYSFDKFLKTGDEEWPALLPMTKSVVRAMDTIQTFLAGKITINDFIVVGGSKRGWTTWLTAAVDPRIKAIAPASIDLLNMGEQFRRHFETYGFYAPAIADYVALDIPNRIATPEGQALLSIVDPYAYRERFTMPKIILNSTGDQFFLPDSSQFYFEELPETKWLRYLPNSDHKQSMDVAKSLASWVDQINDGETPPRYNWTIEPDGAIRVVTINRFPDRVRLWQATNPNARDFRLESIGPVWTANDLAPIEPGIYRGYVPQPPQGWTAYMVELTYEESGLLEPNLVFTTDVVITPDTLPYADDSTQNKTPSANAGPDQTVTAGTLVTLNGNASFDPDHGPSAITYSWSQTGGSSVTLANPTTATPSFTPLAAGTYVFKLTVNDGLTESVPDTASITVNDAAYLIIQSPNGGEVWNEGNKQTISWISHNIDRRKILLLYVSIDNGLKWKKIATPLNTGSKTWNIPKKYYVTKQALFKICLNQKAPLCDTSDAVFTINKAPVAEAGVKQTVIVGTKVVLNGGASYDADNGPAAEITYNWTKTRGPVVTLDGADTDTPSFTPTLKGTYVFGLIVYDGSAYSKKDKVTVSVKAAPKIR